MSLEQISQISQIAGAVVFIVVAIVVWNRWIAPGVKSYQASKNAELADAEALRERMRTDLAVAQGEVGTADADVRTIRERVESANAHERERTLESAKAEGERIVRNADGELERARVAARDRLRIELIEKALMRARTDAAERIDARANSGLVNATVDDLVRGQG